MRTAGKFVFLSTSLILMSLHLSLWIQDNHAFAVKKVVVSGASLLTPAEILDLARFEAGRHIFEADLQALEERIAKLPQVKRVRVARLFPSGIRIELEERRPVALIVDNGLWGVDDEGVLLPRLPSSHGLDYPVIVGLPLKHYIPGEPVDNPRVRELAAFLDELREQNPVVYHSISEITENELLGVQLTLIHNQLPVILGKEDLMQKCSRLEAAEQFLSASGREKSVLYMDLRFEDQVILKRKA